MKGSTSLAECWLGTQLLTEIEEEAVVRYILDLDSQGFPPLIGDVEVMVNSILMSRRARPIRKQWPYHFIQQQEELKTHFSHAYNFQRAFYKDLDIINVWFRLVSNMWARYGIADCDFYNFDKIGFMMGTICSMMVVIYSD